jgi:monoamine oxidase
MDCDVIVVGAGLAGLSAASELRALGLDVLVLEARNKIGGRVDTDYEFASHPIERGAEFVHGENVVTWELIRKLGLQTLSALEDDDSFFIDAAGQFLPIAQAAKLPGGDSLKFMSTRPGVCELAKAWVKSRKPDIDLSSMLQAYGVVFDPKFYPIVSHSFEGLDAAGLQQLGVYGLVETSYEGDGDGDFRIAEGYSSLSHHLARELQIQLAEPVDRITWNASGARVTTAAGSTLETRKIVITVPLAQLQQSAIRFEPPLTPGKQNAINRLGAGHIVKIILQFDGPFWPASMECFATDKHTGFWWRPGWNRPDEASVLTAYAGAALADRLVRLGNEAAIQIALDDLNQLFGNPIKTKYNGGMVLNWQAEPYIEMAYSFCPVGAVGLRRVLSYPVEGVLFFAGEATSVERNATVHGAIESGWRAAKEVSAALA